MGSELPQTIQALLLDLPKRFTKVTGLVSKTMCVLAPVSKVLAGATIGESDKLKLALKRLDAIDVMKTFSAQLRKEVVKVADAQALEQQPDSERQHSFWKMASICISSSPC